MRGTTASMKAFQFLAWGCFLVLLIAGSRFNFGEHLLFTIFTMVVCYGAGIYSGEESANARHRDVMEKRERELAEAGYDPRPYHFKQGEFPLGNKNN